MVRRDLPHTTTTFNTSPKSVTEMREHTKALICLLTSSMPKSSLEIATEMSSLAGSWIENVVLGFG